MKTQRWYEIMDGVAYVYDEPHSQSAQSVSIVKPVDLAYYRSTFNLQKVWKNS